MEENFYTFRTRLKEMQLDISEKDLLRLLTEFISENEKGILEEYQF